MEFNLGDLNPGTWFYFDDDDQEKGGVCLRVLTLGENDRVRRACQKIDYVRGQRIVTSDEKRENEMTWDYAIVDWSGIFDEDTKEPIECNKKNKITLMNGSIRFSGWVSDRLAALNEKAANIDEDRLGN